MIISSRCSGQEDEIEFPTDRNVVELPILDAAGNGIPNVSVQVYAMRCSEEFGSHYGWPTNNMGPAETHVTDEHGIARVDYPVRFGKPNQWRTTVQLTMSINHPSYTSTTFDLNLSDPKSAKLDAGCSLTMVTSDEQGRAVEGLLPLIDWQSTWKQEGNTLSTGGMSAGKKTGLIAAKRENSWLFTDTLSFETNPDVPLHLDDVRLRPGTKLKGRLSKSVPRPVKDGQVWMIAYPTLEPDGPINGDCPEIRDWCDTDEEGNFEFVVPRQCRVQMFAACAGWLVESENPDEIFIHGVLQSVDSSQSELSVQIPMEQAGELQIELLDPFGEAAVGVRVMTWPNILLQSGGSTLLQNDYKTLEAIALRMSGAKPKPYSIENNRYSQLTDSEGRCVLRDIPLRKKESFAVQHPEFDLPIHPESKSRYYSFRLESPEPTEVIQILEAIE